MKIHEFQAKALLRSYGVPLAEGSSVTDVSQVEAVYQSLNSPVVVVKAQIHAGGRGKGGGVKIAKNLNEAKDYASKILGMQLVTHQTGPKGQKVRTLFLEQGCDIAREMYLAVLLDRDTSQIAIIAAAEGGMDIEELAAKTPEKIITIKVDPVLGFGAYQGRELGYALKIDTALHAPLIQLCRSLVKAYTELDASLLEINPLVLTKQNKFVALDAKMTFDDNALYRHPNYNELRDMNEEDPAEMEAQKFNLSYVALDGSVGCMVNGAGLAMATMDVIKLAGAEPANFLDVGGGASKEAVTEAFKIISKDSKVKAILVNIFGGIMRCDTIANGIVEAIKTTGLKLPLVVRLSGNSADLAQKVLKDSGLKIVTAETLEEAAQKAVAAIRGTIS